MTTTTPGYYDFGRMMWVYDNEPEVAVEADKPEVSQEIPKQDDLPKRPKTKIEIVDPKTGSEVHIEPVPVVEKPVSTSSPPTKFCLPGPPPNVPEAMCYTPPFWPYTPPYNPSFPVLDLQTEEIVHDPFNVPRGRGRGRGKKGRKGKAKERRPQVDGRLYMYNNYTASLDGRFWCLSQWPTGERDENHKCQFGRHKLQVLEDGSIRPILSGGVGEYRIALHLASPLDPLGSQDQYGWIIATCAPDLVDLSLTPDAEQLGWVIDNTSHKPLICPPGAARVQENQNGQSKEEEENDEEQEESESEEGEEDEEEDEAQATNEPEENVQS
eukprot:NODE_4119_length_1225_cov_58.663339_g3623_i0.p1 GENE.NODE_4119_length_1225_cov_58.663339_g3623_i0~~NODE_4119_length_1225_cov_58.663339_g3623_i0.p1  ORF type:complete len:343 (+),score=87.78 NODE_4119_length_1225_cov_58.663339_g3623_i0:53-1030(+)